MSQTMRERDVEKTKRDHGGKLEVCEKCGWYTGRFIHSESECNPAMGRVGDALAAEFPEGNPTKLGYGFGYVTFQLDGDLSVRFQIRRDLTIKLEEVWCLKDFSSTGAVMIAKLFKNWAKPGFKP